MIPPGPLTGNSAFEVYFEKIRREQASHRIVDSPDILAHHGMDGVALRLANPIGGGGGRSSQTGVEMMVVKTIGKDHYKCRRVADLSGSSSNWVTVLKPLHLCPSLITINPTLATIDFTDRVTLLEFTASPDGWWSRRQRKVTSDAPDNKTVTMDEIVFPSFDTELTVSSDIEATKLLLVRSLPETSPLWLKSDLSLALSEGSAGAGKQRVRYIDTNELLGRQWMPHLSVYRLCQNGVLYWAAFDASEKTT